MILKPIDIEQFTGLAEKHAGVFASKAWLSNYSSGLTLVGIFKDEKQLIGGFYFLKVRKYGFSFIKLPPYTPHCGLFFLSDSSNRSSQNNFSKEVIAEVCNYIVRENGALTVLAFPSHIVDLQPFIWNKFKVVPNYTYRINLAQSLEEIKGNFDPKNRNVINKAIKDGVTVSTDQLSKTQLFDFFSSTLNTAGARVYKKELRSVFTGFSDAHNSFSLCAINDGKVLGTVFCIYDSETCYYLLGGLSKEHQSTGVNNLLVLKSIETAKNKGCKTFDFEGSMLKGVEKFFRSFGAELIPYFTVNKASLPLEIVLKFKKRELF